MGRAFVAAYVAAPLYIWPCSRSPRPTFRMPPHHPPLRVPVTRLPTTPACSGCLCTPPPPYLPPRAAHLPPLPPTATYHNPRLSPPCYAHGLDGQPGSVPRDVYWRPACTFAGGTRTYPTFPLPAIPVLPPAATAGATTPRGYSLPTFAPACGYGSAFCTLCRRTFVVLPTPRAFCLLPATRQIAFPSGRAGGAARLLWCT